MPDHKLCVPCLFGLEGPLGNELRHMGLRGVMPKTAACAAPARTRTSRA